MKKLLIILLTLLTVAGTAMGGKVQPIPPGDPHWIGNDADFNTTIGDEFWLTYMNNDMFDLLDPNNVGKRFELEVEVSTFEPVTVVIEIGGSVLQQVSLGADTTYVFQVPSAYWEDVYLYESEMRYPSGGVHVYSLPDEDGTPRKFSCFYYSRVKETGGSSRDASLVIPTKYLGREYVIQTYPQSQDATEFAIVATEDATMITITPAFETFYGKPAGVPFTIILNKGEAYLVASMNHVGTDFNVSLSGTTICADKPIAVFNGNQATSIPFKEATSLDFLGEQMQPLSHWGTEFYIAPLSYTKVSQVIVTAQSDNTHVQYMTKTGSVFNFTLNKNESRAPFTVTTGMVIRSDKPIECYSYMSSAAQNSMDGSIDIDGFEDSYSVMYGDPANAMLPSWAHRVSKMNFFTKELDPQSLSTLSLSEQVEAPQHFMVFLVTRTADVSKLKVDGVTVDASAFTPFAANPSMSYGSVEVSAVNEDGSAHNYHVVESTGAGFVGLVYAVTEAQGWQYTLGYTPDPFRDSLFVQAPDDPMSENSYHITKADQGYYQRQWDEWERSYERLDTAYICEGTTMEWLAQFPMQKFVSPVEWYLYEIVEGGTPGMHGTLSTEPLDQYTDNADAGTKEKYKWQYTFDLPDEEDLEPSEREPFMEYELLVVSSKNPYLCPDNEPEMDTLRMAIHVNREYHDTIYRVICMGDTMRCFYDSVPHQQESELDVVGLPASAFAARSDSTCIIGDKTEGESTNEFEWKARPGENIFTRKYQTQYGCDSTYTIYLYVCDTFRVADTIHICEDQAQEYNDTTYYGPKYDFGTHLIPNTYVRLEHDTVVEQVYKTEWCACELDKRYPPFEGCDSVFEIHFVVHPIYRDTLRDTLCATCDDTFEYKWPIQYGQDELVINEHTPEMVWYPELGAWFGTFVDTLRTTTCPECNEGKGCDNIQILELTVPKSYCHDSVVTVCRWEYDYVLHDTIDTIFRWMDHREGDLPKYVDLTRSGDYYDSCKTVNYQCDSVYHLKLTYLEPYIHVDKHEMPNNQTYVWQGHNDNAVYGPYPDIKTETTLYIYDENATKTEEGCDSIVCLELRIVPSYVKDTTIDLCVNKMTTWRDHRIVGAKYANPLSTDTLYNVQTEKYVLIDSLLTVSEPKADSIFRLSLYIHPIYEKFDTVHVCDNQTRIWGDTITYVGQKYTGAVPGKRVKLNQEESDFDYKFSSEDECDSLWHVHVVMHETNHYDDSVTVCQEEKDWYYTWEGHGLDTQGVIYDEDGEPLQFDSILIPNDELSAEGADYIYYDRARTHTCEECQPVGCDSVWTLYLHVNPRYDVTETPVTLCETDYIPWHEGRIYAGDKAELPEGVAYKVISQQQKDGHLVPTQDTAYIHYKTVNGCDSIFRLSITIVPEYQEVVRTDTFHICDTETWVFAHDETQTIAPHHVAANTVEKRVFEATVPVSYGNDCDSAVQHVVFVHPTYMLTENDAVCQTEALDYYVWQGHGVNAHSSDDMVWDEQQHKRIRYDQIPTNVQGATYYYTDSLRTTDCAECASHACDSICRLELTIYPIASYPVQATICEGETYYWAGADTTVMGKAVVRTEDLPLGATKYESEHYEKRYTSEHGCAIVHTLDLTVRPKTYKEVSEHFQTGDPDFTWNDTTYKFNHVYSDERYYWVERNVEQGCDSLVKLILTVDSAYVMQPEDSIVCQNSPFEWTGHPGQRAYLYDKEGNAYSSISTREHGTYVYYDSLKTVYGTDSIYVLSLQVLPVYKDSITRVICQNDTVHWQDSVFAGSLAELPEGEYVTRYFGPGETSHMVNHPTVLMGCDSIFKLHLIVQAAYTTVAATDTTYIHICDNEEYSFKTVTTTTHLLGSDYRNAEHSIVRVKLEGKETTVLGCDSAVCHVVYVHPTYVYEKVDSICQGSVYTWTKHEGHTLWDEREGKHISADAIPTKLKAGVTYTYVDSLKTQTCTDCRNKVGCDSIWYLHLRVDSVYHTTDTITMSDEETRKWEHTIYVGAVVNTDTLSAAWFEPELSEGMARPQVVVVEKNKIINDFDVMYQSMHDCDSLRSLHLLVGPTFRDTIVRYTCDNEPYVWIHAQDTARKEVKPEIEKLTPGLYYDSLRTVQFGFDSIYVLDLRNNLTYLFPEPDTVCQGSPYLWENHTESKRFYLKEEERWIAYDQIPTDSARTLTLIDSLKTKEYALGEGQAPRGGCDSVHVLTLLVHPTYYYYDTLELCQNSYVEWQDSLLVGSLHTGDLPQKEVRETLGADVYDYMINYGTRTCAHSCDSIYHLHLVVKPAYTTAVKIDTTEICDNEEYHFVTHMGGDSVCNGLREWVSGDHLSHEYNLHGWDTTVLGCDSAVHHVVWVHPTYEHWETDSVCQDTINTQWAWYDNLSDTPQLHAYINIADSGWVYPKPDTLLTVHNCDSVFGMRLYVKPKYRNDTTIILCDNDSAEWQHMLFTGRTYAAHGGTYDEARFDSVRVDLEPNEYHYKVHFETRLMCDSDFYLTLIVYPTYDTLTTQSVCESDGYVWYQTDHTGQYTDLIVPAAKCDTIFLTPSQADISVHQIVRDTKMHYSERMLETVHGCDSLSRLTLTVNPTYFFLSDTMICANDYVKYRGKYFANKDTIHTERYTTQAGCDSIYQLRLHIRPIFIAHRNRETCDNVPVYHEGGLGDEFVVWKPGDVIPPNPQYDYIDRNYVDVHGCDSIYRYYVTVYPTTFDTVSGVHLCSDENYTHTFEADEYHPERTHTWAGYGQVFDVDTFVMPFDTTIVDADVSIHGCDSVYVLNATIYPTYHHLDQATICDDDSVSWRAHHYEGSMLDNVPGPGLAAGDYVFYDSLRTRDDMCDSVYEFRLRVTATYLEQTYDTICADEVYVWRQHVYNTADSLLAASPVDYFYYDSLTTVGYGCDSVYHLYLHVLDTTYEVIYDTICDFESYYLHGVEYTETGDYKDTTINEWGCHHFTYLHLQVIPPTIPTAWADSICADQEAYELYFRYDGRDPVSFSLRYDSLGHSQGFEDIDNWVIDGLNPDGVTTLTIPMPDRIKQDPRMYPRPDHYRIRLLLHNGICQTPDSCAPDTSMVLNYPSWLTEQRFRDVIGILNYNYNGWYEFDSYQWYKDDQPIPGEVLPYLYIPTGLEQQTAEYYVRLTRVGETESYQTCPIRIYDDHGTDTIAPYLGYLGVTPTCVSRANPVVYMHSKYGGAYSIYSQQGQVVQYGTFGPNVEEVRLTNLPTGMYIVRLFSSQQSEEMERTVKILVVDGDRVYSPQ